MVDCQLLIRKRSTYKKWNILIVSVFHSVSRCSAHKNGTLLNAFRLRRVSGTGPCAVQCPEERRVLCERPCWDRSFTAIVSKLSATTPGDFISTTPIYLKNNHLVNR
jgi:hypothetical protein